MYVCMYVCLSGGGPVPLDRGRRLQAGHTVVALPGYNPEDPNSALLTHIQVRSPLNTDQNMI